MQEKHAPCDLNDNRAHRKTAKATGGLGGGKELRRYRKSRFQRVTTLLAHGEGGAASQTAELPPDPLPLQRVVGHAERKLQEEGKHTQPVRTSFESSGSVRRNAAPQFGF